MKFLDHHVPGFGVGSGGFDVDVVGLGLVEAPEFSPALLDSQAVGDLSEVSGLDGSVGDLPEGVEAGRLDDSLLSGRRRSAQRGGLVEPVGGPDLRRRLARSEGLEPPTF